MDCTKTRRQRENNNKWRRIKKFPSLQFKRAHTHTPRAILQAWMRERESGRASEPASEKKLLPPSAKLRLGGDAVWKTI